MKKIFVGSLSKDTTELEVRELFSKYGTVRSIQIATDIFTGKCKGFGFIEMEGHEARAAISGLNGASVDGKFIKVKFETPRARRVVKKRR